jgi:hypothetical protein
MVYRGTRVWKFVDFGAWRWTKFDAELNPNEKIKRIMGWWADGSRIQESNKSNQTKLRTPGTRNGNNGDGKTGF